MKLNTKIHEVAGDAVTDLDLSGLPQTSCQVYIGDVDGGVPSGAVDPPSYANSQCFLRLLQNNINSHQIFSIFILYIWIFYETAKFLYLVI